MLKEKIKVAILMGGPSSEHEISLRSGENVFNNLNKEKYKAEKIIIDKQGNWPITLNELKENFDICFIALHGKYGEDGYIQLILEKIKMPYTGSSSLVSALCMNKYLTIEILKKENILTPNSLLISKIEWQRNKEVIIKKIKNYFNLPIVNKPNDHGSSYLIFLVKNFNDLEFSFEKIFKESHYALVEEYIKGKEITCGVLDYGIKNSAYALLPTEIIVRDREFFDYYAKYDSKLTLEITPPRLNHSLIEFIQKQALKIHNILNCRGISRSDFILTQDNKLYFLEINTIPGLTERSLIPQAALKTGISFESLIDRIILAGFNSFKR